MKKIMKLAQSAINSFKKRSLKFKVGIVGILSVIILVASFVLTKNNKNADYTADFVTRADIVEVVSETGSVVTAGKTPVYSASKGIVEELYVKNGDLVGIDQPLFKVKSTSTQDEKAAALSTLLAAQSSLKTSEQTKLTYQTQLEQARQSVIDAQQAIDDMADARTANPDVYTQLEIDSIESALTSARYNFTTLEKKYVESDTDIQAKRASVSSASLSYESTKDRTITSPAIGTVSNLSISEGDSVSAAPSLTDPNTVPALSIANFSSNQITVDITESDIAHVESGQDVKIVPDAIKDAEYTGVIKRVDDIGTQNQGVITYKVYIEILNADERLKSGMTVDVDIVTRTSKNTLSVPNAAIKPYQGGRAVRVFNPSTDQIEYIPVRIGIRGEERTEIVEGLSEGDEIVVSLTGENTKKRGLLGL